MPQLDAVLETALYVDDLKRARRFYEDILALSPIYEDARLVAYAVGGRSVPHAVSLHEVHSGADLVREVVAAVGPIVLQVVEQ